MSIGTTRKFSVEQLLNEYAGDDDGLQKVIRIKSAANPVDGYQINDNDSDASPNYYGFTDKDGNWYVMKETIAAGANTYRYATLTLNPTVTLYSDAWTARTTTLIYGYFYEAF